jgi:hypothetical protein
MLQEFPPKINAVLNKELPKTQKFWWVRGVILEVVEIERATANPEKQNPGGRLRNMVLKVGDLDNPDDGYDFEIEGIHHQIEPNDLVSLLGHEPKNAKQVSHPRLVLNHSTGYFQRTYPLSKRLNWGVLPLIERKYVLAAKTPANPAEKLKNFWILLAVFVFPIVLLSFMVGPYGPIIVLGALLFLLAPWVIMVFLLLKFLGWIESQPRFTFEKEPAGLLVTNWRGFVNFNRHDLTPLYEKLAGLFYDHVAENPAPEIGFEPVDRGMETVGALK